MFFARTAMRRLNADLWTVAVKMETRAGIPTVQMAPSARERRPLASSPGGGRHARSGGPRNGVTPPAKTAGTAWNADLWPVLPVGAGTRGPEDRATGYRHLGRSARTALPDAAGGDAYRRSRPTLRRLTATAPDRRRSPPAGVARAAGGTACRLPEARTPIRSSTTFPHPALQAGRNSRSFRLSPYRATSSCRPNGGTTDAASPTGQPRFPPRRRSRW